MPAAGARFGFHLNNFIRKLYYDCYICPQKDKSFPESVKIIVNRVLSCLNKSRVALRSQRAVSQHKAEQYINLCFDLPGNAMCQLSHHTASKCDVA